MVFNPFPGLAMFSKFSFGWFGKFFVGIVSSKLLFRGTLSIIFFSLIFLDAFQAALKTGDWTIFLIRIGAVVFNADIAIKESVKIIQSEGGSFLKWLVVFGNVWFMYMIFKIWMKIVNVLTGEILQSFVRLFMVLFIVGTLQIIYSLATKQLFHLPFSGLMELLNIILFQVDASKLLGQYKRFAFNDGGTVESIINITSNMK